jgi:hypothetical protein
LFILLFLISIPFKAFAYNVLSDFHYDSANNNYYINTSDTWEYFTALFQGSAYTGGPYWFRHIAGKQDMTVGCNGTYTLSFYDGSGNLVGRDSVTTTDIVNPTCHSDFGGSSIPDPFRNMDVNVSTANGGTVSWVSSFTNTGGYDVFKDGTYLGNVGTNTTYNDGNYSPGDVYEIHSLDKYNTVVGIGRSDGGTQALWNTTGAGGYVTDGNFGIDHTSGYTETPPNSSGGGGTTPTPFDPNCPECQTLRNQLQCPEWQTYMGDLGTTIKNNVPPAPDWQQVANTMRDTMIPAMDTMLGHPDPPPAPPTPPPVPEMKTDDLKRPDDPQDTTPPVTQDINFDNVQAVPVQQDTTGGLDLTPADPTESIEHKDPGYMPKPGKESGGDKPMTQQAPTPKPLGGEPAEAPAAKPTNSGGQLPPGGMPKPTTSTGTTPTPTAPNTSTSPSPSPTLPPP